MIHDEIKKRRSIMLTDTTWFTIGEIAYSKGLSASELALAMGTHPLVCFGFIPPLKDTQEINFFGFISWVGGLSPLIPVIFYRSLDNGIEVIRVLDGSRDITQIFDDS